jgi:hypothetical protein
MSRPRFWLISTVIAAIIGGSLFDVGTGREHWPFSPYKMYDRALQEPYTTTLRLFGFTGGVQPREIHLNETRYTEPMNRIRLHHALATMMSVGEAPAGEQRLREALNACLKRYEVLRQAGRHHGPPLQGIRLYRLTWKLDPWARNAGRPDRKEFLIEVRRR